MRIFSGLQFEKGVDYSSIQIVCERVILFQLEKCRQVYWINARE